MLATLRRPLLAAGNYTFTYNARTYNAYIENGTNGGLGQAWPWAVELALGKAVNAVLWLQLPLCCGPSASMTSLSRILLTRIRACRVVAWL